MSTTPVALPPPPPTPEDAAGAVRTVPQTRGEKVLEAIGSRAEAFASGAGQLNGTPRRNFEDTAVGKALQKNYDTRLAEARRNWQDAQTKLQVLNSNVDPQSGQPLTPQQRQDLYNEAQGAWGAYAKAAGVDKETKAQIAQKGNLFNLALTHGIAAAHEIAKKLGVGGDQGGGQPAAGGAQGKGITPPPTPGPQQAPGAGPSANASATANPAVPPPPAPKYDPGMNADAGTVRAEMGQRNKLAMTQAEENIKSNAKIKEEEAKARSAKFIYKVDEETGNLMAVDPADPTRPPVPIMKADGTPLKTGMTTEDKKDIDDWKERNKESLAKLRQTLQSKTPSKSAPFSAGYLASRLLQDAWRYNPKMLPAVGEIIKNVFEAAGIKTDPASLKAMGEIPLDQPLSPTTGEPIGTAMPGAPTGPTRSSAQIAARVNTELPRIRKEVEDLKGYLGPESGRANVSFLLGKVGSTGDPHKDQALNQFRTDMKLLASAAAKFHISSVRAIADIEEAANSGKDSSAALNGFIDSISEWATTAQKQETGAGERGGMTGPPGGTTRFTDGGRTYNIPNNRVAEFKKDHPNAASASAR